MKIHVGTVHLVTSNQKYCHEEGLGLLVVMPETAAFGTFLSEGCVGRFVFFMKIHVGIVHLVTRAQKCCQEAALGCDWLLYQTLQLSEHF